jgi:ABC-2 type transport system permease protein
MSAGKSFFGLSCHFLLSLKLNFRSMQAIVYGYLVPIFFLVAFGSVFRSEIPPLFHQMGQLLTISILGGACFGLPTALVAERERGVWRRYRLLPVPTGSLVVVTLVTRLVIVGSAAVLQILLAKLIYHTPLPQHVGQIFVAFLFVGFAFLGLGLLIAALADSVPAVQALGQCLFLPMIMIGGVGIPLAALPLWAQRVAGFMPGRYAVEVLQCCFTDPRGLRDTGFSLFALVVIGTAAGCAGLKLFRWDSGRQANRSTFAWLGTAAVAWIVVGLAASATGNLDPVLPDTITYESITDEQINRITFEGLPGDNELVTRLAPPFKTNEVPERVRDFSLKLKTWPLGKIEDPGQRVRNFLSVAAIADIGADLREAEIGRIIFDELQAQYGRDQLCHILAWVILRPGDGSVLTHVPDLRLRRELSEQIVRERCVLYAKKYLGRLLRKLPD